MEASLSFSEILTMGRLLLGLSIQHYRFPSDWTAHPLGLSLYRLQHTIILV